MTKGFADAKNYRHFATSVVIFFFFLRISFVLNINYFHDIFKQKFADLFYWKIYNLSGLFLLTEEERGNCQTIFVNIGAPIWWYSLISVIGVVGGVGEEEDQTTIELVAQFFLQ